MIGKREEAEVIVRLDQFEGNVHICVHAWPAMYRKMVRLYGPSRDGEAKHSARWVLPLKVISFRRVSQKSSKRTGLPFPGRKRRAEGQSGENL